MKTANIFRRVAKAALGSVGVVATNNVFQASQVEEKKERLFKESLKQSKTNHGFGSVEEIVKIHIDASVKGKDLKTTLTTDRSTMDLAAQIISDHVAKENLDENAQESLRKMVIAAKDDDINQKGSIPVLIDKIEGSEFESVRQEYEKSLRNGGKRRMVCVGGPAAVDQALMALAIPEIAAKTDVTYIGAGHWYSNLVNSALQVHARHGNALNADDALTGHALLATLATRGILNLVDSSNETRDAIDNPGYRKIHVKFTLDPEKLGIYLGNEGNWLKQKIVKKIFGQKDQHDLNREESVISAEIMHCLQNALSENLGREFKIIEGNKRDNPVSSSIHVALTQGEVEESKVENEHLAEIGIGSMELNRERIEELFGKNSGILAAFSYHGDGHVVPQYHASAQKFVQDSGQEWMEPALVKKVLLKNDEGKAQVAGVLVEENGEQRFIAADSLHFTGGYMAKLMIAGSSEELLSNPTTIATGASSNVILKRNEVTENFIREFGNTGQLAVTNSHWTMLAKNDEHVILRVTGGGNTGSEEYNPNYVLNNITNTLRIFQGDDKNAESPLVGIIRTYGCPRSINAINATSFEKLSEGFLVSYGKGGTGNTKRFSEAAIALSELGFKTEVINYFEQFQTAEGKNLGGEISEMITAFKGERAFFSDSCDRVEKGVGYREKSIFDFDKTDWSDLSDIELSNIITGGKASSLKPKSKGFATYFGKNQ